MDRDGERLQKVLARAGVASRRAAEALITAGRVRVNGEPVTKLGVRVDARRDRIEVDGRPVAVPAAHTYLMLHKPAGYVTTAHDELGRPTVLDLVPAEPRLFPVGRLDVDTEGLLLLTDDGDLALRLTHPRHGVEKTYRALVRGVPDSAALRRLREGVEIEGRPTLPARVDLLERHGDTAELRLTIREGRKRQIRLMGAAVGHPVLRLRRERLGPLELGDLPAGRWRRLTRDEVVALYEAASPGTGAVRRRGSDAGRAAGNRPPPQPAPRERSSPQPAPGSRRSQAWRGMNGAPRQNG